MLPNFPLSTSYFYAMRPLMLIAAPWALFNRPSIQLATLKAYLRQNFSDLEVQAAHLHLQTAAHIGYSLYQKISERSWLSEAVAARLLFPENAREIERLFRRETGGDKELEQVGLEVLAEQLDGLFTRFLDTVPWHRFALVGFSVSLCQTTSSLLLIHRLKKRCPQAVVVVGGSSLAGERPERLTRLIPEINHLVRGEGEKALAELVAHYCLGPERKESFPAPPAAPIVDLDSLPPPDFSDYFELLKTLPSHRRFFPTLPLEMSRGCRWQARPVSPTATGKPRDGACAFCNLNLQWQGYRHKSAPKVAREIADLSNRHRLLSLSFTDNLLPSREGDQLMQSLAERGRDLRIFVEVRADTGPGRLQTMHRAGVRNLQVGIEALSSRLLAKMGKGTTTLQNIEMLRHCEALGLDHGGNLMLGFPGSDADDVAQTLCNLRRVAMFRPLQPVQFWLGLHSPICNSPESHGITLTGNHGNWRVLLGRHLGTELRLLVQGYRGGLGRQKRMWAPVAGALKEWRHSYRKLMQGGLERQRAPILGYQDGGDFLIINERRADDNLRHRLTSTSRRIYLHCRTTRSRAQLQTAFSSTSADRLDAFLQMMLDKGLMFEEAGRYLSLAVPMDPGLERFDLPLSETEVDTAG